jgi:hypothetical protein
MVTLSRDNIYEHYCLLGCDGVYFTMKMKAEGSSETSVYQTTLRHISEDSNVYSNRCDGLKSRTVAETDYPESMSHVSLLFTHLNTVFSVTAAETKGDAGSRDIYCSIKSEAGQGQKVPKRDLALEERNKKKSRGFGPLANYTDRANAACW